MNRMVKKLARNVVLFLFLSALLVTPSSVFASSGDSASSDYDGSVETTYFGTVQENNEGCGVFMVLNLILDILTFGVAIAAIVGVAIAGTVYLTAKGNEQQTTKAKRRLFEIVIGLVAYAILYAALGFLLPGGKLNSNSKCSQATTSKSPNNSGGGGNNNGGNNGKDGKDVKTSKPKSQYSSPGDLVAQTARELAWPAKPSSKYQYRYNGGCFSSYKSFNKTGKPTKAYWNALNKVTGTKKHCGQTDVGADCGQFVTTVVKYSGYTSMKYGKAESYFLADSRWKTIKSPNKKKKEKLKKGDVCIHQGSHFHIWIYLGNGKIAEAQHDGKTFGHIADGKCGDANYIFRAVKYGDKKKLKKWRGIKIE